MPSLICLVQRLFLKDHTLIKEGERFEVDEQTAVIYIKGGIARAAPQPVPTPAPAPAPAPEPATPKEPEKVTIDKKKRR